VLSARSGLNFLPIAIEKSSRITRALMAVSCRSAVECSSRNCYENGVIPIFHWKPHAVGVIGIHLWRSAESQRHGVFFFLNEYTRYDRGRIRRLIFDSMTGGPTGFSSGAVLRAA
jgi:hypothetical protein